MSISRRKMIYGMGAGLALPSLMEATTFLPELPQKVAANSGPIHLDRNENPYGPPEAALAAMRERLNNINRYPDRTRVLESKIAAGHKVTPDQVIVGCGSSEILRMVCDAFLKPGKKLMTATPSFPLVVFTARVKGAEVVEIPLTANGAHDLQAMLARCDGSTGLVHICNPNNPTGTLTPRREIDEFLQKLPTDIPVVVDEAYHHYVDASAPYVSLIDKPAGDKRTIVARTFSKIYALAGARVGYAVIPKEFDDRMFEERLQFGVNAMVIEGALAALDDIDHVPRAAKRNADARREFIAQAKVRGKTVSESHTNFMLLPVERPVDEYVAHFRKNNVMVTHFRPIDNAVRVSMGRPEDMKEFWRVWDLPPNGG